MVKEEIQGKTIEILPFSNVNKISKFEKGVLLNEWEKLTAPSNRRLKHQSLTLSFRMHWSIDRITLVGFLKEFYFDHDFITEDGEIIYQSGERFTVAQAMPVLEREGGAERAGKGWKLVDKYGENIAYVEVLPFKDKETNREKARIDFNPNKIERFLKVTLTDFIALMFDKPHFSRADVACDILDLPNDLVRGYRMADPVSFRPYFGIGGALETAYWGARSSERQVRLYNKFLEQTKKGHIPPEDTKTWWRLEVQLRRDKADNWTNIIYETLDSFYSLNFLSSQMKTTDKIMLFGLLTEHQLISQLSSNTRRKYRKLMKNIAKEDELTQHLKSSFSESIEDLQIELMSWLRKLKVDEEG